jgi:hypothetical protein
MGNKSKVKMRIKQIGLILSILCLAGAALAQDKPQLVTRVEQVFREKEPTWKIEDIYVSDTLDPFAQRFALRSGKNLMLVEISIWKREKDAQDVFAAESIAFDNIRGKGIVKSRLADLGDENYIWANRGSPALPWIIFRKGKIEVAVYAPSVTVAKRFARHVLEQMAAI